MINTSEITAVTKSSMKRRYRKLSPSGERNGEKSRTKVSFGKTTM